MSKLEACVKSNVGQTATLAQKLSDVEGQVHAQGQAISKQLDERFSSQLLAKKPRNE